MCDAFEGTRLYVPSASYSESASCTPKWPCTSIRNGFFFCPFTTFSASTDLLFSLLSSALCFVFSLVAWLIRVHAVDFWPFSERSDSHSLRSRLKAHQWFSYSSHGARVRGSSTLHTSRSYMTAHARTKVKTSCSCAFSVRHASILLFVAVFVPVLKHMILFIPENILASGYTPIVCQYFWGIKELSWTRTTQIQ